MTTPDLDLDGGAGALDPDPLVDPGKVISLADFMKSVKPLTKDERAVVVDQASVLLEQLYVHLPLKRAIHGIDPVQRLKLLRHRLGEMSERQFHDELLSIIAEPRDLHTNYILPNPYRGRTVVLPFLVEEFVEDGKRQYLVTKVKRDFDDPLFKVGVVVTHWNGVPIERVIELNGLHQGGSNADAQHARGLLTLTLRPMALCPVPDEDEVGVRFIGSDKQSHESRHTWRVFTFDPTLLPAGAEADVDSTSHELGVDALAETTRRVKKLLFAPAAMDLERESTARRAQAAVVGADLDELPRTTSILPDTFTFRSVSTQSGEVGYLRIWTFGEKNTFAFFQEAQRILKTVPQTGLIVDVRGNGGGVLRNGEMLLQLLSQSTIQPEVFQLICTPLTLRLCRFNHDLEPWVASIDASVETGAIFSDAFPLVKSTDANGVGQIYQGPVVLVTDALCYSTTDSFAAGFQDHRIGQIMGLHLRTGAGGANVWTHDLLLHNLAGPDSPLAALPREASFRVSLRRAIRVGAQAGALLEELGVKRDVEYSMTRNDLLDTERPNQDMIEAAASLLKKVVRRSLSATANPPTDGMVTVETTSLGTDRVDLYERLDSDGNLRPIGSSNVIDSRSSFDLTGPWSAPRTFQLLGFAKGKPVVATRLQVPATTSP